MNLIEYLAADVPAQVTDVGALHARVLEHRRVHPLNAVADEIRLTAVNHEDGLRKRINQAIRALRANGTTVHGYLTPDADSSADVKFHVTFDRYGVREFRVTADTRELLHVAQAALLSAYVPVVAVDSERGWEYLRLCDCAAFVHEMRWAHVPPSVAEADLLPVIDEIADATDPGRGLGTRASLFEAGVQPSDVQRAKDGEVEPSSVAEQLQAGMTVDDMIAYRHRLVQADLRVAWFRSPHPPSVMHAAVKVLRVTDPADLPAALAASPLKDLAALVSFAADGGTRAHLREVDSPQQLPDAQAGLLSAEVREQLAEFSLTADDVRPYFQADRRLRDVRRVSEWIDAGIDAQTAARWTQAEPRFASFRRARTWIDAAAPFNDPRIAGRFEALGMSVELAVAAGEILRSVESGR